MKNKIKVLTLAYFLMLPLVKVNASSIDTVMLDVTVKGDVNIASMLLVGTFFLALSIPFILGFIWILLYLIKGSEWLHGSYERDGHLAFAPNQEALPSSEEIPVVKEIPCNKDLLIIYWIAYTYNIYDYLQTYEIEECVPPEECLLGTYLLKWLKERKINFVDSKDTYILDLSNTVECENKIENELLNLLRQAAGKKETLNIQQLDKWFYKNSVKLSAWFKSIDAKIEEDLINKGLIKLEEKEIAASYGRRRKITIKVVDSKLYDEAIKVKGFKKYLENFEIESPNITDTNKIEEYLIYAELLGVANKVSNRLEDSNNLKYWYIKAIKTYRSNLYENFDFDNIRNLTS